MDTNQPTHVKAFALENLRYAQKRYILSWNTLCVSDLKINVESGAQKKKQKHSRI